MSGRIAIVGAGPRGLSLLERLIANRELAGPGPLAIDVFDPHGPGGRVWDPGQPQHLLMNTRCGDATHFTDETVTCAGPVVPGPTLFDWCTRVAAGEIDAPAELRAEAAELEPWGHPSRQLLGRYLAWCADEDVARAPAGWRIEFRREEVAAVRRLGAGFGVQASGEIRRYDAVLIAAGHADLLPDAREAAAARHARRLGAYYTGPTNPVSADLSGIAAGRPLAVRGLGMNFFDYMSLLTVGRGGVFAETPEGLRYRPSGDEPVLVVGSGRGIPYRAKMQFHGPRPKFEARYLTTERLAALGAAGRLEFGRDLWPLIAKDTALTWYAALARVRPGALRGGLDDLTAALDAHAWGSDALARRLVELCPDPADRLDLQRLGDPLDGVRLPGLAALRAWWRADLDRDYAESVLGVDSPEKCASVVFGAGRSALRSIGRYGGLIGARSDEVLAWHTRVAAAVASGPPAARIRELAALVDAGLVVPVGARMQVDAVAGGFRVRSASVPEAIDCDGLLEAHLPPADAARTANPLLADLQHRGLARRYAPPGERPTGALEVGGSPYRLVGADGVEIAGLYAVGVPLEGLHRGTQLGPLAGTNSQFLRDTDAVARAALADVASAARSEEADAERTPAAKS